MRDPAELELIAYRLTRDLAEKIVRKSKTFDGSEIAARLMPVVLEELTRACERAESWRKNPNG